ncbi:unnamed protein product [Peniophora sp. CBMAI 1063]|nr:unnamed protein product [Peniophora sp. CBMAI 1063]
MNLGRQSISATPPLVLHDLRLDIPSEIFSLSCPQGWTVHRAYPPELVRKRPVSGGTLSIVCPLHASSLVFLVGGGAAPRYAPNKVVFWDDRLGKEVAELEFRERVRGLACRREWLAVALRRRVVVFEIGRDIKRYAEWDTCDNPKGLLAIATDAHATLLAVPGRQIGHVQLIHLPPCRPPAPPPPAAGAPSKPQPKPPPPSRTRPPSHSVLVAHNSALSTLAVTPSGRLVATTSARGTLVRVWDVATGKRVSELRRGTDQAEIYGVAFRPDEAELAVWSDKGTVHVFALAGGDGARAGPANRQSKFNSLTSYIPLPTYFTSEWSYAQWTVPARTAHLALAQATGGKRDPGLADEEKCVVGWIMAPPADPPSSASVPGKGKGKAVAGPSGSGQELEWQLVALTYAGGWYRLALPRAAAGDADDASSVRSGGSVRSGASWSGGGKGKGRAGAGGDEGEKRKKQSRECVLLEYRRFGSWDGWG